MVTNPAADELDGLVNFRDLGGLPARDGALTRAGVLYRSDAPYAGDRDPDGVVWPPAAVLDLRDSSEQGSQGHPLAGVTTVHRISLLEDVRGSERTGDAGDELSALYRLIVTEAADKLVKAFRIIAAQDGPVLIHCAAGKDRTGVLSALLLRSAGVSAESVVADYARTDPNMFRVLQRLNVAPELPPGVDEKAVNDLIAAPIEAIQGVLDHFDQYDGGAEGWLLSQGVERDVIDRWQRRFLAR